MENTEKLLLDSKFAAEDIIRDLERVVNRANETLLIGMTADQVRAISPQLLELQVAIFQARDLALKARPDLVRGIGMRFGTWLTPLKPFTNAKC